MIEDRDVFSLLHPRLRIVIERLGYERPTRIQRIAIPRLLASERHSLIIAPTGSGKTEAALFPILSKILLRGARNPEILYITPLRALNRDLSERLDKIFTSLGLSMGVWHGDTPRSARRRIAGSPPNMIVTTPESLQYILVNKNLAEHLSNIGYVIVDEIHELMPSERGCELIAALERLRRYSRSFIRIGLSGSIGNPDDAARFLAGSMANVDIIIDRSEKPCRITVHSPLPDTDSGSGNRDPFFSARISKIYDILSRNSGSAIIFTNTRDQAERIGSELKSMGVNVGVHHGSLSREARENIERSLREGMLKAVVATSSLELGIDVGSIDLVIQYLSPRQAIKMLQRVGRSGHREDLESRGYIIASENIYDIAESMVIARRACSRRSYREIERLGIRSMPLDVLAHQLVGLVLEMDSIYIEDAVKTLSRAYCFRDLDEAVVNKVVSFLSDIGVIKVSEKDGRKILSRGRRARQYYYKVTMIVDTKSYRVIDIASNRAVGELDERFVAKEISEGAVIVLGGSLWRVVGIEDDRVYIEAAESSEGSIPRWVGQQIPVDSRIAREVCMLYRLIASGSKIVSSYPGDGETLKRLAEAVRRHTEIGIPLPGDGVIIIESWREHGVNMSIIHACIGSKANEALGLYISSHMPGSISYRATPYGVIIASQAFIGSRDIASILTMWRDRDEIYSRVIGSARSSGLYRWHLVAAAKKMGMVDKDVPFDEALKHARLFENTLVGEEAIGDMIYEELDLETLVKTLEEIKAGRTRIVALDLSRPSPLGEEIYRGVSGFERVRSQFIPRSIAAELIRRRLEEKEAQLVCIICGHTYREKVSRLPERVLCPSCGSVFVGVNKYGYERAEDLVRRIARNPGILRDPKGLSDDEKEAIDMLRKTANLVASYGRKAVLVLMARGVGPEAARDILANHHGDEDLYMKILEREKIYLSTRKYWD